MLSRQPRHRALVVSLVAACLGVSGCASLVRKPAKAATEGALSGAAEGLRAEDVAELTSQVTVGVVRGLARAAEDPTLRTGVERIVTAVSRGVVAGLVNAATAPGEAGRQPVAGRAGSAGPVGAAGEMLGGAAADALMRRRGEILSFVGTLSAEVGRGLVRGMGEEMARQAARGRPGESGPVGEAVVATAGRASAAAVRGALEAASSSVPCPEGADREQCLQRFARGLSRASATGASEAVQQKASPWPSVIAFVLGAALMLLLTAAWRTAVRRRGAATTAA